MTKHLDKIQKLIALTSSPNVHEAKLAALKAVKLMVKHDLAPGKSPARRQKPNMEATLLKLEVSALKSQLATQRLTSRLRIQELERQLQHASKASPMSGVRMFLSRYEGTCDVCGERYYKGDHVAWKKGVFTRHTACHNGGES